MLKTVARLARLCGIVMCMLYCRFRKERRIEDIQPSASHAHTMLTAHDAGGISSSKKKCLGQMWFGVATTRGQPCLQTFAE